MRYLRLLNKLFWGAGMPGVLLLLYPILLLIITRKRSMSQAAEVDVSASIQIIYVLLCLFFGFIFFVNKGKRAFKAFILKGPSLFLFLFIILGFISALWSSNPSLSVFRAIENLSFLVIIHAIVFILISKYGPEDILRWAIFYAVWNLVVDILFNVKMVGLDFLALPFTASRLFFPLFFFLFLFLTKNKILKILMLSFAILGVSNKIYFGISAGLIALLFSDFKYKFYFGFIAFIVLLSYMYLGLEDLLLNTVYYGRDSIGLEDSSGRNQIWSYLYKEGLKKPFLGHGFVAGEVDLLASSAWEGAINSHNSFMSAFVNNGILGFMLILIYFLYTIKNSFSKVFPRKKWLPAIMSTTIMVFVINMAAPGIGSRVYGAWIPSVFLLTLILGLRYKFINLKITSKKVS
ncbi:O-antigen ligase family protein [Winogradskyella sp.]|uniref:O-antigen ligase family protein n=1 Tax=Winogradskyella sp. TaxID=1883156 RepID=UPI0026257BE7|nr:O-antigen ligase family protein [Winogradskyella sp.]